MIKKLAATGVLGFAVAASALAAAPAQAATYGGGGDGSNNSTSGNFGVLNGNQVIVPVSIAANVCGNAVSVIGIASAQCKGIAEVDD